MTEASKQNPLLKGLLIIGVVILCLIAIASLSVVWKPGGAGEEAVDIDVEVVAREDKSRKADEGKPLSTFTPEEMQNLPIVKKMYYRIVVTSTITTEQVRPTVEKLVEEIRQNDPDIDEIILWLYSDKALAQGPYDIAMATWAVNGKLGHVTPKIAVSNDRSGYGYTIDIKEDLESYLAERRKAETRMGLSETKRREIWMDLVQAEARAEKEAEAKFSLNENVTQEKVEAMKAFEYQLIEKYTAEVLKQYNLTQEQSEQITSEALAKNWPTH